jgi:hypothetical protein
VPDLTIFANAVYGTTILDRAATAVAGGVPLRYTRTGGDVAVLASMLRGLRRLGVRFNCNPKREARIAPVVIVQSDLDALRYALELKSRGVIQTLLAGPNLVVLPHEHGGMLADPRIDICLVPSDWVKVAYEEDAPALVGRIQVWAAGVDERRWSPARSRNRSDHRHVLLYSKTDSDGPARETTDVLERRNVDVEVVDYGAYDARSYRRVLSRCSLAVFLSRSESQGLALVEAWAMDVPTLVWDPGDLEYAGHRYSQTSSAPYLTPLTGHTWKSTTELDRLVEHAPTAGYSPRKWVVENMTAEIAAAKLVEIAGVAR